MILEEGKPKNTFAVIAEEWFTRYSHELSEKHVVRLRRRLDAKILPAVGSKLIIECMPEDFLTIAAIDEKAGHFEAAHRVMYICNQVLEYARVTGRVPYNVAAGLTKVLTTPKVKHRAALTDPKKIGQLLRDIDNYQGFFSVIYYLKILPYLFTRPTELRLATWSEFDLDTALWSIPAARMKKDRDYLVPLSHQAISLLKELRQFCQNEYLFPSIKTKARTISDATALTALRRMGYTQEEQCLHGFRTIASTILNELGFRSDVIEKQLSHEERNKVRNAYNRAEYLDERRRMMQTWANYLDELKIGKDANFTDK